MHRYKEQPIKMQIVSYQCFSKGGRIREGLQKKKKEKKMANLKATYQNGHYDGWSVATMK